MILTCYGCKLPFIVAHWNPLRQVAVCPTSTCGRHVHVGEAAERLYGPRVGKQVKDILTALSRVADHVRGDLSYEIELDARRIEGILNVAERLRQFEAKHSVVISPKKLPRPTRAPVSLDICWVIEKLTRQKRLTAPRTDM